MEEHSAGFAIEPELVFGAEGVRDLTQYRQRREQHLLPQAGPCARVLAGMLTRRHYGGDVRSQAFPGRFRTSLCSILPHEGSCGSARQPSQTGLLPIPPEQTESRIDRQEPGIEEAIALRRRKPA